MNSVNYEIIKKIYPNIIDKNNPCYIYNLEQIRCNARNIMNYMPNNFKLYYAMKANNNPKILGYIKKVCNVEGFEVASSGEIEKALNYCDSDKIIFTGPGKTERELELAISKGIRLINVESVVEAIRINNIAERLKILKVDVLLRINMDYKIVDAAENMGGISTKMGIDENEYNDNYEYINKLKHINVLGIHVFSASGILNYKSSIEYAKYVFDIVKRLEHSGQRIQIIDLGGGIGVDYTGKGQVFDTEKYFQKLKILIDEYNFSNKEFILELGCYLVAECGYYLSRIIDIKESKGYKHIVLTGGLNHIPTATLNGKHPFYIVHMNEKKMYEKQIAVNKEIVDIDGPLCTAEDKVLWDVYVEEANIGDIVVIKLAGAYCYSAAWLEFLSHDYPCEIVLDDLGVLEVC